MVAWFVGALTSHSVDDTLWRRVDQIPLGTCLLCDVYSLIILDNVTKYKEQREKFIRLLYEDKMSPVFISLNNLIFDRRKHMYTIYYIFFHLNIKFLIFQKVLLCNAKTHAAHEQL